MPYETDASLRSESMVLLEHYKRKHDETCAELVSDAYLRCLSVAGTGDSIARGRFVTGIRRVNYAHRWIIWRNSKAGFADQCRWLCVVEVRGIRQACEYFYGAPLLWVWPLQFICFCELPHCVAGRWLRKPSN
jgi:hypothetical protein